MLECHCKYHQRYSIPGLPLKHNQSTTKVLSYQEKPARESEKKTGKLLCTYPACIVVNTEVIAGRHLGFDVMMVGLEIAIHFLYKWVIWTLCRYNVTTVSTASKMSNAMIQQYTSRWVDSRLAGLLEHFGSAMQFWFLLIITSTDWAQDWHLPYISFRVGNKICVIFSISLR